MVCSPPPATVAIALLLCVVTKKGVLMSRDNPDGEEVEYPPPQPLDGEIDREMETDENTTFVVASDGPIQPDTSNESPETSKHPANEPIASAGEVADDAEDVDEIGSEDEEEEEEEEEEGDISLDEEEIEEEEEEEIEEVEGEDDEEMQDVDGDVDEDVTMQSVEHAGQQQAVAQSS